MARAGKQKGSAHPNVEAAVRGWQNHEYADMGAAMDTLERGNSHLYEEMSPDVDAKTVEVAAQQVSDAGPGSGVPLLQALQPGVRRTMPRAASTAASGLAAASRAAATHGLGGGADPARVRSNRQLQNARKRAK